ncbi:MAG: nucleotidyltransferase family protein [Saprospiraceae bacterium]|nr:nucleotidyltransferase family protein [Saprospiraceae bacterium]
MKNKLQDRILDQGVDLLTALKQMDTIDKKLLLVFDGTKFINIISIGDIQRAILKNIPLSTQIKDILRENTRIAQEKDSLESVKETMKKYRMECMPVINDKMDLVNVYFWEEVFGLDQKRVIGKLNLPVVIMAGGKGTRLKPITNIFPKPLIPIGLKTIIEEIMDRFVEVGCSKFYISVNYKAETIKHYFEQLNNKVYHINYIQEEKPLGTAGSLFMLKEKIHSTFFVSNCDIIIKEDYSEILKYHNKNKNELTIVSALKHYPISYGTVETKEDGVLIELIEKPELTFQINTGMYILEPHLLSEIPENDFFHITNLIENIKNRNGKIGVFPVSEGSWKDIGDWNEYLKLIS